MLGCSVSYSAYYFRAMLLCRLVAVRQCGVISAVLIEIFEGYITGGVSSVPYGLNAAAAFDV